ncbi:hypothetical protein [Pontimicrobium aquaticum]|uniref:Uncharacterized protein n=1 Tax=Pontimicrobium aquaticum TaxID=2565367 RepID=A0A4U0EN43_9FLAO|nr:hypothetical protein [Pontimicrobium aquaticum]TJY32848.1 hypothetical protein E5167_13495 [Pontimicrobium aquaticum]
MRQLKTLLLAVTLTFSSVLIASTNPEDPTSEFSKITVNIEKFLKSPNFDVNHEMKANVTLTLNKNNELVVLCVDSEDDKMEGFIKSRLNYKKVAGSYSTLKGKFIVPVRITTRG